ncbi:hypothetical protein P691DRAFT_788968 [Macrolepiota fuliginosa MF-IS2]|uniref:Uncharacterized protein n=1 Tax=Macrolepiota fuliginosa MF-IS2 TaxID=1400762 RepID=A0A9P5X1K0_9AGAR|nr:hypothetical protein P691DRAFT_788968 [Macrolepiota fuliginosa MF-IS2]
MGPSLIQPTAPSAPIKIDNNGEDASVYDKLTPAGELTNAIAAFGLWFEDNNITDNEHPSLINNIRNRKENKPSPLSTHSAILGVKPMGNCNGRVLCYRKGLWTAVDCSQKNGELSHSASGTSSYDRIYLCCFPLKALALNTACLWAHSPNPFGTLAESGPPRTRDVNLIGNSPCGLYLDDAFYNGRSSEDMLRIVILGQSLTGTRLQVSQY